MDEYKFSGVELTPAIFSKLLIELFDGKQFKRTTAIDEVVKFHQDKGGLLGKKEYVSVFKKACQMLSEQGLVNRGYGTWRLNYQVLETKVLKEKPPEGNDLFVPEKIIGDGTESVYLYYYDTYRKYAETNSKCIWECKIGRTEQDPLNRIFNQAGTCYPEMPIVALVIRCENAVYLESALHGIFRFKNRWIKTAPGTEWFLTSPDEVEKLYQYIVK